MFTRLLTTFNNPSFKIIFIIVSLFFIAGIIVWQDNVNFFPEPIPPINAVDKKTTELGSNISVGLYIDNFPQFSSLQRLPLTFLSQTTARQ